jgi:hypothetical protein
MRKRLLQFLSNPTNTYVLYALFAVAASLQALLGGPKTYHEGGTAYLRYNNYVIFKQSFWHLVGQQDLYVHYPTEHWDLYKYTPTFAAFFGFLAVLPDWLGVNLWSLLNAWALVAGIYWLPHLSVRAKSLILLFCLLEMMTSLQNGQSNGLMAGLIVLAFGAFERQRLGWAALLLVASTYLKLFGLVALVFGLMYPRKWQSAAYCGLWIGAFFVVPLLFVDAAQYSFLWKSYAHMLSEDHSGSYGYSVMGWLRSWFGWEAPKLGVVLLGGVILLLPFLRISAYRQARFRLLALASVLIWVVIFNHKAESPTFIIALAGVGIWYFSKPASWLDHALFWSAFVLTSLSVTDLFPPLLRDMWVHPYALKAVPCIFIWLKINLEMHQNAILNGSGADS